MKANARRSNIMCCVGGCSNSYNNTDNSVKFYGFPGRWYEQERRKIWIQRVRRTKNDKKRWEPKVHDKICSAHFIGNLKSDIQLNPSYHPTIFPKEYRTSSNENLKTGRFLRNAQRSSLKPSTSTSVETEINLNNEPPELYSIDFSQQVNFDNENENFTFECTFTKDSNEISTQANIPLFSTMKSTSDKCVGNSDSVNCEGFHGYETLKNDHEINSLCGVTMATFVFLLSAIETPHKNCKLSIKNQLLLFLMKMKLGLSYSALGVLLNIHNSSVSRIFFKILNQLTQKFKNVVYWPTRSTIEELLPEAFKIHYPKCRVIIDCTEIKINCPNQIDQRIYTYSNYKGSFTAKFLIGIAPHGFITFISKTYGGRSSDSFITNDSGILDLLQTGDIVLADKGFPGIRCKDDVVIVMPPFIHQRILTFEEVEDTYNIASVRIHVERSIQRVKLYHILQNVPNNLFPYLDEIILMSCILTNLQPKIINECEIDK